MAQFFSLHKENPQHRLIKQAANIVRNGGVIVFPTDSTYAIGCQLNNKVALMRIRQVRQLDKKHYFTLICRDLSEISTYANIDNKIYRLLKSLTPGPYTFLLTATKEVPRRLLHFKRKTIGIRVPDCKICLDLLEELGEPLMSSSLILPEDSEPVRDPKEIEKRIGKQVDVILGGGVCGIELTSVIDLYSGEPIVVREGKGDTSFV